MEFRCNVCDRSILENESEFKEYLATLRKKNDKSFFKKILLIMLLWMNPIKY